MSGNPDHCRRKPAAEHDTAYYVAKARAVADRLEGEAVLAAWGRLLEALEHERGANSVEARAAAQQAALEADAALAEATGSAGLRKRRMLVALDDLAPGSISAAGQDYQRRIGHTIKDGTPRGRIRLRRTTARLTYDLEGIVGAPLARHVSAHMLETASGRIGLMHAETLQGVSPDTAAAFGLRRTVVAKTGYTIGVEMKKSRVPPAYWARAAKVHNALVAGLQANGQKVVTVTAETFRSWCTREGDLRHLFEESRADGRRDRDTGKRDEARMLRSPSQK